MAHSGQLIVNAVLALALGAIVGCSSKKDAAENVANAPLSANSQQSEPDVEQASADAGPSGTSAVSDDPAQNDSTGTISGVTINGVSGAFQAGSPPVQVGSIALEPLTRTGAAPINIISGGSTQIPLTANKPFTTVFINSGDAGYFRVDLPSATNSVNVVIQHSTRQLDGQQTNIDISVQSATGDVSVEQSIAVSSVVVGTGELQVSVSWDTKTDIDLHLLEPDGTEIYYFTPVSDSGGELDLDSNVLCVFDDINNENITYQNASPPVGEYLVTLAYFSACDEQGPTNYVVTVRNNGLVSTYEGVFMRENENGLKDRRVITTVEVQ